MCTNKRKFSFNDYLRLNEYGRNVFYIANTFKIKK